MKDVRIVKTFVLKGIENTGGLMYSLKLPNNEIMILNVKIHSHKQLVGFLKELHNKGDGYRLMCDIEPTLPNYIMELLNDYNYKIKVKLKLCH